MQSEKFNFSKVASFIGIYFGIGDKFWVMVGLHSNSLGISEGNINFEIVLVGYRKRRAKKFLLQTDNGLATVRFGHRPCAKHNHVS